MIPRSLTERSTYVFAVLFFVIGLFIFALFQKQVIEHDEYAKAAEEQSTSTQLQPAERGKILAKDNEGKTYLLAVSETRYQLDLTPRSVKNPEKLVAALKEDLPNLDETKTLEALKSKKVYAGNILKDISADEARKVIDKDYVGVSLRPSTIRVYPEADKIAAQILGFVSGGDGKYGVEATYNDKLTGSSGSQSAKRDSLGRLIDILGSEVA